MAMGLRPQGRLHQDGFDRGAIRKLGMRQRHTQQSRAVAARPRRFTPAALFLLNAEPR